MSHLSDLNSRIDGWLSLRIVPLAVVVGVLMMAPLATGLTGPGYLVSGACAAAVAALLTVLVPRDDRRVFGSLLLVALLARLLVHPAVFAWTSAAGGPFLGPDSTKYFEESIQLSADDFSTYLHPALYFGTYDSVHYYVFAALVRLVGPDLYALQWWNCSLTAIAAALTYPLARRVAVAPAALAGLVVALYPSFIVLGAKDLLKDPAVVLAAVVTVWSWLALMQGSALRNVVAFAVASTLAMSYLRMSRPYAFYFLEFALLATFAVAWWQGQRVFRRRAAVLAFALAVLTAEVVPWTIGWPPSPAMFLTQFTHTSASVQMRQYSSGLVDTLASAEMREEETLARRRDARPRDARERTTQANRRATRTPAEPRETRPPGDRREPQTRRPAEEVRGDDRTPRKKVREIPPPEPESIHGRLTRLAANGVRKTFGPFVWVMPPSWDAHTLTTGEFLLYPGMVMWYALLPALVVALFVVARHALSRHRFDPVKLLLSLYIAGLAALYLAINLSYRQRDFLFAFAVVLSLAVVPTVSTRVWWRVYVAYALVLMGLASAHLVLKAVLA